MELLAGFGFRGYRSVYSQELQFIAPLKKINLIAGQNNSGKSNVLRVATDLAKLRANAPSGLDAPRNNPMCQFELAIDLGPRSKVAPFVIRSLGDDGFLDRERDLEQVLASGALDLNSDNHVWLRYAQSEAGDRRMTLEAQALSLGDVKRNLSRYYQARGRISSDVAADARDLMHQIDRFLPLPSMRLVQASRRIAEAGTAEDLSGAGLIPRLGHLQSPRLEDDEDRERFAAINDFVKSVLDDPTAQLHIPQTADQIIVRRQNLALPLENLGTGVAQVIILAAAATLETNTVVCMEEPEVHLHPLLQRKLLKYLHDSTDNQYLISTHSAHLLDSEIASVFHATYTEHGTQLKFAGNPYQLSAVCQDLGYRPSDLLQTNCAIWVEGPSDRIYLAHWLSLVNPDLREGIHYSIMFYGGRLLNHLSPDDPDVDEFISLRRLNRHLAVVIDSDRKSEGSRINKTKRRIQDTMKDPGLVWVTRGRNIENYVPAELLERVLNDVYSKPLTGNTDRFSDVLRPVAANAHGPDKVKVAREVRRRWKSGLNYLDLHKMVVQLAALIESANGDRPAVATKVEKTPPTFDLS